MDGLFLPNCIKISGDRQKYRFVIIFLILVYLAQASLFAGGIEADYFTFKSGIPNKTHLDLYFSITNSEITFFATDESFNSSVSATVFIKNDDDELIDKQFLNEYILAKSFEESINSRIENIFKFTFLLDPGQYTASIVFEDKSNCRVFKKKLDVNIPEYSSCEMLMSSLQLSTSLEQPDQILLPNIQNIYIYSNPCFKLYFETYNINCDEIEFFISTHILFLNKEGIVVQEQTRNTKVDKSDSGFEIYLSVHNLPSGEYTLFISQVDELNDKTAFSEKQIEVVQSPIDLRFKEYDLVLEELKYIAKPDQIEVMKNVHAYERQSVIKKYWEKKDPSPNTEINELMIEYYSRIKDSNKLFSRNSCPGWKSDFGLVYILFGKPDRILREESLLGFEERQIWQYRKLGFNFTFLNWDNLNNYSLLEKPYIYANYIPE